MLEKIRKLLEREKSSPAPRPYQDKGKKRELHPKVREFLLELGLDPERVAEERRTAGLPLVEFLVRQHGVTYEEVGRALAKVFGKEFRASVSGLRRVGEFLIDEEGRKYHFLPRSEADVIIPRDVYLSFFRSGEEGREGDVRNVFLEYVLRAKREGAQDLILSPTLSMYEVYFKYPGDVGARRVGILSFEEGQALINAVMVMAGMTYSKEDQPQSGAIRLPEAGLELRCEVIKTVHGKSLSVRVIETSGYFTATLEQLGYPKDLVEKILERARSVQGLILVSGATGSGKSTFISAVINQIQSEALRRDRRLVVKTVEDPVERTLRGVDHVQRKEGVLEFPDALKSFLRQNPDVIVVGEVRDPETAQLVIRASRTGHLTFTTIHASSSVDALLRFKDELQKSGETEKSVGQIFASNLLMSLNLRLLRGKGGKIYPVVEAFIPDEEDRDLLAQGRYWEIYRKLRKKGLTFDFEVRRLLEKGLVDEEVALAHLSFSTKG